MTITLTTSPLQNLHRLRASGSRKVLPRNNKNKHQNIKQSNTGQKTGTGIEKMNMVRSLMTASTVEALQTIGQDRVTIGMITTRWMTLEITDGEGVVVDEEALLMRDLKILGVPEGVAIVMNLSVTSPIILRDDREVISEVSLAMKNIGVGAVHHPNVVNIVTIDVVAETKIMTMTIVVITITWIGEVVQTMITILIATITMMSMDVKMKKTDTEENMKGRNGTEEWIDNEVVGSPLLIKDEDLSAKLHAVVDEDEVEALVMKITITTKMIGHTNTTIEIENDTHMMPGEDHQINKGKDQV